LEKSAPLEFILRLNPFSENNILLSKNIQFGKRDFTQIEKIDSEYGDQLYRVWHKLYYQGSIEKRVLDKVFELSVDYTNQVETLAQNKLNKKIRIEKAKTITGSLVTTALSTYGLTGIWGLSLAPVMLPQTLIWSLGTGISLYEIAKKIRELLDFDKVIKEKIDKKLRKNILKGNIVNIEMIHQLHS
jgi:hypothetical protein